MAALNGRETPNEANRQLKTVKEVCDYFLSELRTNMEGKLKCWHLGIEKKEKTDHPTVKKYKVLLNKLVVWSTENKFTLLREIDDLLPFVQSWTGRKLPNGKVPDKSVLCRSKEQELLKQVFRRWVELGFIAEKDNPALRLKPIKVGDPDPHPALQEAIVDEELDGYVDLIVMKEIAEEMRIEIRAMLEKGLK
jgi:hypothetical protein